MKNSANSVVPSLQYTTSIPRGYSKKAIRILPCTPTRAYVYWELPISEKKPAGALALRFSDHTASTLKPSVITTVLLPTDTRSTYLELPQTTSVLLAELGMQNEAENFTPLCSTIVKPSPVYSDTPEIQEESAPAQEQPLTEKTHPAKLEHTHVTSRPAVSPVSPHEHITVAVSPNPSSWIHK